MARTTIDPDTQVVNVTESKGTARAHRQSCRRGEHGFETTGYTAVNMHRAVAATCCKPTLPTPRPQASTDPVERVRLAKAEHKLLKAWISDGSKPPRPHTPNLDAIEADHAARAGKPRKGRRSTAKAPRTTAAEGIVFTHNGRPMAASQNKLSSVAYYYTAKVDGDAPRVSTARLVDILAAAGITDPLTTEWTHTLPNGITLGATLPHARRRSSAA